MAYVGLILLFLAVGATVAAWVAWMMASLLLMPPRMNGGKALYVLKRLVPTDIGLSYIETSFEFPDRARPSRPLTIAAWWIPAAKPSATTILLLHGYADAKVGALAWAPTLAAAGANLLLIDSRAHGESTGRHSTAGFFESDDVLEVLDQAAQRWPESTRRIVLFGTSLGAATAILAAAKVATRTPGVARHGPPNLVGVIADSPFAHFAAAARRHAELLLLPAKGLSRLAIWIASRRSGADLASISPLGLLQSKRLSCPVLLLQSGTDPFISGPEKSLYADAVAKLPAPSRAVMFDKSYHICALAEQTAEYQQAVGEFLAALG